MIFNLSEHGDPHCVLANTDAGARTAQYVSVKNVSGDVFMYCTILKGAAAAVTLTLYQASAVAATGEKVMTNNVAIRSNLACGTSSAGMTQRTAAKLYATDATNSVIQSVIFQIPPDAFDVNNDFDCLTVKTAGAAAGNIVHVSVVAGGLKVGGDSPLEWTTD